MSDGAGRDEFDELVLDESFVQGGRREPSAEERVERLKRIARESTSSDGWRAAPAVAVASPPRRRRHRLRTTVLVLSIALSLLLAASWAQGQGVLGTSGLQPAAGADEVGEPPAQAVTAAGDPPPGAAPAPPPERLAPLPADPGGEGGYRFIETHEATGGPVTYDPCRPIRYVVRRIGEPVGSDALLESAIAELSAATGLVFQRGADTGETPGDRRKAVQPDRYGPDFAPVLIAWSDEQESPDLAGYVAGVAGSEWNGWDEASLRYVTGTVLLDREDAALAMAFPGGDASVRSTILHELGHLVGLDHVADRDQIMFSEGGDNRLELGPGDRRGLRLLGDGTCHTDWAGLAEAS